MRPLPLITALAICLPGILPAGPLVMPPDEAVKIEPVPIETFAAWKALPAGTTAVSLKFPGSWKRGEFTTIMRALAKNPDVRRIDLGISSFRTTKDPLEVLREFHSLESLNIDDVREGGSTQLLGHVAEMKNLKQASFAFF
jgi:hypothetical protein